MTKRRWFWPIILVMIIGAALRFYRLSATLQFLGDQGRDALVLRQMLVEHDLPFIGPITSVGGFYLGPLYYYLMVPWLWLFRFNPVGPAYATAAIGALTIPAVYFIAKKMFSGKTALWASGLYAVASVPVIETRGMWNPNPMPLAVLGLVVGFYQAQKSKDRRWLWLSAVCLGAALQFHYMIVFLGPFILWQLILAARVPRLRRGVIEWVGIVVLTMLPLILFELKNHWLNTKGLIEYLTKNDYGAFNFWQTLKNLRGRSEEAIGMLLGFGRNTNLVRTLVTRSFLLGLIWLWLKKPSPELKLISWWLLLSIPGLAFFHGGIYPYYLGFLFPAVFMLTGLMLSQFKNWLWPLAITFLLFFAQANLPEIKSALSATGNLKSVQKTARFITDDASVNQYSNYNLSLIDETRDYRAQAFRYFVKVYGGKPLGEEDYPQTKVLYVVSPYKQTNVLAMQNWEIKSLQPASIVQVWEFDGSENIYKLIRL